MQERSPTEKKKMSRTLFLVLFSQSPGAIFILPCSHLFLQTPGMVDATWNPEADGSTILSTCKTQPHASCFLQGSLLPISLISLAALQSVTPCWKWTWLKKRFYFQSGPSSLQLSLYSLSTSAGMEQDEILSSMAWGKISYSFSWLKQVAWLHTELGSHSWQVFCPCFVSWKLSLPSITSQSSFSLLHVDFQAASCIQDSSRIGESAWGDTWTLLCPPFLQAVSRNMKSCHDCSHFYYMSKNSFHKYKWIFSSTELVTLKEIASRNFSQSDVYFVTGHSDSQSLIRYSSLSVGKKEGKAL